MKYITSALVLLALFGNQEQANAIRIKATFTDDLVKSLAEEMQKDAEGEGETQQAGPPAQPTTTRPNNTLGAHQAMAQKKAAPAPAAHNHSNNTHPAVAQKKTVATKKKEEEDIPMDAAAIKAYSSVIADAAEDSEPAVPVQYQATLQEEEGHAVRQDDKLLGSDPMGSMI